jgi:hypothetical protein
MGKAWLLSLMRRAALGTGQGQAKVWLGDVFTTDSSANLKLLNGNKLCATPVTYVVIWSPGEGELGINVYSGSKAPTGTGGLCASYFYQTP